MRVPPGVLPGAELQFANPRTGNYFKAVVPPGVGVNQIFLVDVPLLSPRPGSSAPEVSPRDRGGQRAQPPPVTYPSYRPVATDASTRTPPPPTNTPRHRHGSVLAAAQHSLAGAQRSQEESELAAAIAASVSEQYALSRRRMEEDAADRMAALQIAAAVQQSEAEARRNELSRVNSVQPARMGGRAPAAVPGSEQVCRPQSPREASAWVPSPPSTPPPPPPPRPPLHQEPAAAAADSPASCSSILDPDPSCPARRESAAPLAAGAAGLYPSPSGTVGARESSRVDPSLAEQHAECAFCFDDLHSSPCSVFRCGDVRVCHHFLHERCARLLTKKECPLCLAAFEDFGPVPALESDPEAWFRCVDLSGAGSLTKAQVIEALLTQFPLEPMRFEAAVEKNWARWVSAEPGSRSRDSPASSVITFERFVASGSGLLAFTRAHLKRESEGPGSGSLPVPDIASERLRWFDYFDEDGAGALSQEAVTRGLIKTYGTDIAQVSQVRELVVAVWGLFAEGGSQEGLVTREAFLRPADGLADAIIAGRESLGRQTSSR